MTSALVITYDANQKPHQARMLLDTCATANFATEHFVKKLRLPRVKYFCQISALNNLTTTVNSSVSITFQSRYSEFKKTLHFLVVPSIADLIPEQTIPRELLKIPPNIQLADTDFHKPGSVDMLIGAGTTLSLFSIGTYNLSQKNHDLYLQKTRLGWIIGGGLDLSPDSGKNKTSKCMITDLKGAIEKFWEVEEVSSNITWSQEELDCESHFKSNVSRDDSGRYVVALPFKNNTPVLGESRQLALKRFNNLQKRFKNDPEIRKNYTEVINEYISLGHMTLIETPRQNEGFYLPHHAVHKISSNTTKLRVVFDGSAKSSSGISLNESLMVGPTIQDDLFSLIIRFRTHKYVLMADIEKMYRQFLIRKEDRTFQKILWQKDNEVVEYELNTVTFGLAPASFLAIRCLLQLAEDEGYQYPVGAEKLKSDMYVDNLITGANTLDEARAIYKQMTNLLKRAQLNLRQWATNELTVLEGVDEKSLDNDFNLNKDCVLKTLGIFWKSKEDSFIYKIKSPNVFETITKRNVLSEIAKLFDPLGLLGPVILYAKQLMQEIWQAKISWDESLPSSIHYKWMNFCSQLEALNEIAFPRRISVDNSSSIQLHGFCDASEHGYGACIYIRAEKNDGECQCFLLCSKSRVAPLKQITIPRLELCGALLLAELHVKVLNSLKIKFDSYTFWTDSEIVLHWLHTQPNRLKTFIANRVSQIQNHTNIEDWHHVRSYDNPADGLSRGQLPNDFLKNNLWLHGPTWLKQSATSWHNFKTIHYSSDVVLPEMKKVQCMTSKMQPNCFEKFSSYSKLLRVIALCYRVHPAHKRKGHITLTELRNSEILIIRSIQSTYFSKEIQSLINNKTIDPKSRINNLNPLIDKSRLLRVGGRLNNSEISYNKRHPIILPKSNFLTDLIVRHYHEINLHTGPQATLYAIRSKFWIIDGKTQVKKITRKCVPCFKAKPKLSIYRMGDLPAVRVVKARPFINVGVDYCGPFYIKERKFRNLRYLKIYAAIFICMSVKAIHIEVVSDLTTDAYIGALRRFIARRGKPNLIYSDNATNFQGAKNELNELYALLQSDELNNSVNRFSCDNQIEFHFIPPSSPHFGGLWEAGVKSYKHHLKRVASNALFTFEEFNTLSIEIESILNSRPLTPMSTDPSDLTALTPGHFLIGEPIISLPEPDFLPIPQNRLSAWQLICKVRQDFWKRWHIEYLNELNMRQKWNVDTINPKIGMLVILKEDNVPCLQWPLARIIELHPGKDGIVRAVTLRLSGDRVFKRNLTKIAILPIDDNINV